MFRTTNRKKRHGHDRSAQSDPNPDQIYQSSLRQLTGSLGPILGTDCDGPSGFGKCQGFVHSSGEGTCKVRGFRPLDFIGLPISSGVTPKDPMTFIILLNSSLPSMSYWTVNATEFRPV
jgi:hypothetical protein